LPNVYTPIDKTSTDYEAHPMIYLLMTIVFTAWIGYSLWKAIVEERKHSDDKQERGILLGELKSIREALEKMSSSKRTDDDK